MSGVRDSLVDPDKHRLQLEETIQKLRQALQHWQVWDAEYEALKEEIDAVSATSEEELASIRDGFEGELVNRKEINEIFGESKLKSRDQIRNVLERRIDYVTKNIETLQKQVEDAENKHTAAMVISQPDATDEDGPPITEIIEELDDDDNVVSYRLNQPGESLPHIRDALEKAGVKDIAQDDSEVTQDKPQPPIVEEQSVEPKNAPESSSQVTDAVSKAEKPKVKGVVKFADDTKAGDDAKPLVSRTAKRVEQIMKTAKEQEDMKSEDAVIPDDEDPEDAELRQQMLRYSMGEVGAVVAELQLDDGDSDEDDYEFDYSDEGFEDDDEDKYGRSTGVMVTDDYRQRMLELEQRLGIKSRFTNQSTDQADESSGSDDEGIGRIVVNPNPATPSSSSKPAPTKPSIKGALANGDGKKGVRFASTLDIAPEETSVSKPTDPVERSEPVVEPLSEVVIERSSSPKPASTEAKSTTKKASRFKKARAGGVTSGQNEIIPKGPLDVPARFFDEDRPTAPTGPEGTTIADTLVERDTVAAPIPPDEIDDTIVQAEVADEHQRLRKKFIQREGGFLKEDESPILPLDETQGGRERVSRFKAARLSKQ